MTDERLLEMAIEARKNAYVPYSGYAVGAALETKDGHVFTGCNVENAAYGNTLCAERTALVKAVFVTWDGHVDRVPLAELLPYGFGPSSLGK